ncbi:MAG: BsuPI-related putative proteinase inhibitor [bacterium]|jgi:hypothetical protein
MRTRGAWVAALWLAGLAACSGPGPAGGGEPGPAAGPQRQVTVEGVTYTAEVRIAETAPPTVYATARVTNTSSSRQTISFPDGCVVLLRAYRDAARAGAPAWDQQRGAFCTMQLVELDLAPGESREFQASTRADEILGDSLPVGRYYFTALLRPNGRAVEVPAGEGDLGR